MIGNDLFNAIYLVSGRTESRTQDFWSLKPMIFPHQFHEKSQNSTGLVSENYLWLVCFPPHLISFFNQHGPQSLKLFSHQTWISVSSSTCPIAPALKTLHKVNPIIFLFLYSSRLLTINGEKLYNHIKIMILNSCTLSTNSIPFTYYWSGPSPALSSCSKCPALSFASHASL